jgi:hypothetical protein
MVFFPSDSDNENELDGLKKCDENSNDRKINSNSKKLTGKIISFIRKLRNENVNENLEAGDECEGEYEEDDEDEEAEIQNEETITILNEDYDFDIEDIEQISDYCDSDNEQDDAYSIISTPKPRLQPFFKNLSHQNSDNSQLMINSENKTYEFNVPFTNNNNININLDFVDSVELEKVKIAQKFEYKLMNITSDNDLFLLIDETDALMVHFSHEFNFEAHLLIKSFAELKIFNETLLKMLPKMQQPFKLVIIGPDQFLNKYTQSYLDSRNEPFTHLVKHYFVPRSKSILASYIARINGTYCKLFCDEFWLKIDELMVELSCAITFSLVWERICKYVESKRDGDSVSFQIGECILKTDNTKTVRCLPFLCDVRIGFPCVKATAAVDQALETTLQSKNLNNSLSLEVNTEINPHFNMNRLIENDRFVQYTSYLSNSNRDSPPNSPQDAQCQDELGYNLQLDYWNLSSVVHSDRLTGTYSAPSINASMIMQHSNLLKESMFTKANKTSVKALFKSLQIYRTNFLKSNLQCTSDIDPLNNLTIIYLIKEKKQKIMRLGKKSKESEHKETIEGSTKLVCTSRSQHIPLSVFIDDIEYDNIKLLQMSSLWNDNIKNLNIFIP